MAALGIVYGDLGTSPLYTYQTIVGSVGGHPSAEDALGLLSLVVWSLIITVSIKYCVFVMRADNHGEGGILALMALVTGRAGRSGGALVVAGLFGAALIYGDGIITPAISVLSALEGINVVTDAFKPYVLPAALVVLLLLFGAQMKGTARIGRVFGPVMLLWFVVIAVLGLSGVLRRPEVRARDRPQACRPLRRCPWRAYLRRARRRVPGAHRRRGTVCRHGPFRAQADPVVLVWRRAAGAAAVLCWADRVAAGESRAWRAIRSSSSPRTGRWCRWWCWRPLRTIIASQAIITGAFSLTRQAMQLGWFPGLNIRQTSDEEYGQIYVPGGELDDDGLHAVPDFQLRQLRQAGRRVRHRGVDHDAADHGAAVQRHARYLALAEQSSRCW